MQTPPPHPDSQSDAERLLGIVRGLARELRPNAQDAEHLGLDHLLERDFGLDSLARVEWLVRIERELGAKLGEKAFVDAETTGDLLRQIAGTASAETPAPVGIPMFAEAKVYHPPQTASTLIELLVRIERELGAKLGEKAFVDAETPAPAGAPVFAEVKVYHPPQAASTLIEILDWHVARHAEWVHFTLYDEEEHTEDITYRMLQEQTKAFAAAQICLRGQTGVAAHSDCRHSIAPTR